MKSYLVEKTDRLSGRVTVGGCKNTSLKAALAFPQIAKGSLQLKNVSTNSQLKFALQVLEICGAKNKKISLDTAELSADFIDTRNNIFDVAIPQMRHFDRMAVAMVTHGEIFNMPLPGYSPYGPRSFQPVLESLVDFGIEAYMNGANATLAWPIKERLFGEELKIVQPGIACRMISEALLSAAIGRRGKTILLNIAQEPDMSDLVDLYTAFAPVRISGKGTSKLIIESEGIDVSKEYNCQFIIPGDYLEAATIAAAVLAVGGDVTIDGFDIDRFLPIVPAIRGFGGDVHLGINEVRIIANGRPKPFNLCTGIYPGFPTDVQGPFLTVAALASESCTVKETIWSNRLCQAAELNRMAARITLLDNQTAVTQPLKELVGTTVTGTCPRSTAGLLIAGLCAQGQTTVSGVDLLRNAYGKLEENLLQLGAKFNVVETDGEKEMRLNSVFSRLEAF